MTWKGFHPVLERLETAYKKGVRVGKKFFQSIAVKDNASLIASKTLYNYSASRWVTSVEVGYFLRVTLTIG
jgi:hypothetical protein